jgi:hypothetical protein
VNELVTVLVLAGIAAAVWYCTKPPAVFVVRVRDGNPEATHGTVTGAFLAAVTDVCREFGITVGEVYGVARVRRISLRFSAHFPGQARQRLRNWWALSGWSAPRPLRPPRSRKR